MAYVKRRLLQFGLVVGPVLMFGTGALFIRGFWRSDHFDFDRMFTDRADFVTEHAELHFAAGEWSFRWQRMTDIGGAALTYSEMNVPWEMRHVVSHPWPPLRMGKFHYDSDVIEDDMKRVAGRAGAVPAWCVVLVATLLSGTSALVLWRERRHRRRRTHGMCPTCTYDLRGAAHERCPECGEAVVASVRV